MSSGKCEARVGNYDEVYPCGKPALGNSTRCPDHIEAGIKSLVADIAGITTEQGRLFKEKSKKQHELATLRSALQVQPYTILVTTKDHREIRMNFSDRESFLERDALLHGMSKLRGVDTGVATGDTNVVFTDVPYTWDEMLVVFAVKGN